MKRVRDQGERFVLCSHGEAHAAIVSLEDLEFLERLEDLVDADEALRVLADIEAGRDETISLEELAAEVGIELDDVASTAQSNAIQ